MTTYTIERRRSRLGWDTVATFNLVGNRDAVWEAWEILTNHSEGDYRIVEWDGAGIPKVLTP